MFAVYDARTLELIGAWEERPGDWTLISMQYGGRRHLVLAEIEESPDALRIMEDAFENGTNLWVVVTREGKVRLTS
jgi:hypothetical protein